MPELLKINPDFKLIIAGDGPERNNYELQIKNYELGDYIKMTGGLKQEELWKYMRASDIFILNTGYEGLSHLLLEAMRMSLPIITTNIGGNPEVIENNRTGLLVEYNNRDQIKNAIIELWRDKRRANQLSGEAILAVEKKFSKQKMIGDILRFFNKEYEHRN